MTTLRDKIEQDIRVLGEGLTNAIHKIAELRDRIAVLEKRSQDATFEDELAAPVPVRKLVQLNGHPVGEPLNPEEFKQIPNATTSNSKAKKESDRLAVLGLWQSLSKQIPDEEHFDRVLRIQQIGAYGSITRVRDLVQRSGIVLKNKSPAVINDEVKVKVHDTYKKLAAQFPNETLGELGSRIAASKLVSRTAATKILAEFGVTTASHKARK
jgi:hypothetical protein